MGKNKRNLLLMGFLVFVMLFGLCLGFGLNCQVQKVYAIGGEPNELAKPEQVMFISQTIDEFGDNLPTGVSFENGVLTIGADYNRSQGSGPDQPAYIVVNTSNGERADLTVVINKNAFYCSIANPSGNLTIVANKVVDALEVVAGENLTIKGSNMFTNISPKYLMFNHNPDKYSAIYAGEKLTIEGSVNCRLYDSSNTKSALCAKYLEINTEGTVWLNATSSPESSNYRAPIAFHSCGSANDLAGKLVVKQGELTLKKYYNSEETENNSKFGFVGYSTNNTGYLSSSSFDTEYKTLTGYSYAINNGDGAYQRLVVKNRTVSFNKNGGTGDNVSYTYLPVGKEVTLPECTFTAPTNKKFVGWQVGDETKQPGETFVLLDGENDYVVNAVWEDVEVGTTYTVTYKPNNEAGGIVKSNIPAGSYNLEDNHFAAQPGKQFKAWNVNGVEKQPGDTITISENTIIIAVWEDVEVGTTYTVTYKPNNEAGGIVKSNIPAGSYNLEDNHFAAQPGKQFKAWNVNGTEKQPGDTITISENTIIIAVWKDITATGYTITVNSGTSNNGSPEVGTTVTITANAPEEGYEFDEWVGEGVIFEDKNSMTTSFVMPAGNVSISATYKQVSVPYTPNENEDVGGLSAGAIVAIVIASLAVLGGAGFCGYYFVIRKKKNAK